MENADTFGSNPSPKTVEPPVDINSTSIECPNNASEEQIVKKCEHFTIRGYVAEMRKKDWKRTWPFPLDNYNGKSEEENPSLPPLCAPEFRRWNCQNCLQEIGVKPSDADVGVVLFSKHNGFESKGISTNLSSIRGSALSSGSHQPSKQAVAERIEIDLNKSVTIDSSKNLSSSSEGIDTEAKAIETTITGHENIFMHNRQEIPVLTSSVAMEVDSGEIEEGQKVETTSNKALFKSKPNGSVVLEKTSHGSRNVLDIDILHKNPGSMVSSFAELDQTEKQAPADNEDMELTAAQQTSVLDETHAEGLVHGNTFGKPCLEVDDSEDEVFETRVFSGRNGDQDIRDISSSTSQRRRPRKTRLLIDLLGETGDPKAKHIPKKNIPINQNQNSPSTVPVGPDTEQGNEKSSKVQSKKKKSSHDEEWNLLQPRFQSNAVNQIRGGAEMAETSGCSKPKDASIRPVTLNGMKRHHTDPTHKSLISEKKKKRKLQDGYLNVQKEHENNKEKRSLTGFGSSFSGQGDCPSKRNVLYDEVKTHQVEDQVQIVPLQDGRLIKDLNVIKYVDPSKTGSHATPLRIRDYPTVEQGFGFPLTSYPGGHSFIGKHYQVREGQTSMTRQDIYLEGRTKDKDVTKFVMRPYVSSTSVQDSLLGHRGAPLDLNSKAPPYRIPNLNDRQTAETEQAVLFPVRSSDFLGSTNKKHMEPQEHSVSSRKYGDQSGNKISEQGGIDDVPMDIVELMAKNQYERLIESNVNDMNTQKQSHAPKWLLNTMSQRPDLSSNGIQFSASSSSRPNSNQNLKWNADIVGQGSKHGSMQALGVCKTRPLPQGEEAASRWPLRAPNHMPLKCNITQKCTTRPMIMDVPSDHHWQRGTSFLNLNVPVLESRSKNFPVDNYGRTSTDYPQSSKHNTIDLNQSPVGPLDLNSKETISAMQLLSLMDAGMRSGPSFNLDPMPKFFNRTSRPQAGCSREFSSPQSMTNKRSGTVMLPQPNYLGMHCYSERSNGYFQSVPAAEASTSAQRKVTGSFNPMMSPLPFISEDFGSNSSACSSKRDSESEMCTVNKNPADFTVPGPNNECMIQPCDLNFGDTIPPKSRSRQMNTSHSGGRGRSKNKSV